MRYPLRLLPMVVLVLLSAVSLGPLVAAAPLPAGWQTTAPATAHIAGVTMMPAAPCSTASFASSPVNMPLITMGNFVIERNQSKSFHVSDGSHLDAI